MFKKLSYEELVAEAIDYINKLPTVNSVEEFSARIRNKIFDSMDFSYELKSKNARLFEDPADVKTLRERYNFLTKLYKRYDRMIGFYSRVYIFQKTNTTEYTWYSTTHRKSYVIRIDGIDIYSFNYTVIEYAEVIKRYIFSNDKHIGCHASIDFVLKLDQMLKDLENYTKDSIIPAYEYAKEIQVKNVLNEVMSRNI